MWEKKFRTVFQLWKIKFDQLKFGPNSFSAGVYFENLRFLPSLVNNSFKKAKCTRVGSLEFSDMIDRFYKHNSFKNTIKILIRTNLENCPSLFVLLNCVTLAKSILKRAVQNEIWNFTLFYHEHISCNSLIYAKKLWETMMDYGHFRKQPYKYTSWQSFMYYIIKESWNVNFTSLINLIFFPQYLKNHFLIQGTIFSKITSNF